MPGRNRTYVAARRADYDSARVRVARPRGSAGTTNTECSVYPLSTWMGYDASPLLQPKRSVGLFKRLGVRRHGVPSRVWTKASYRACAAEVESVRIHNSAPSRL